MTQNLRRKKYKYPPNNLTKQNLFPYQWHHMQISQMTYLYASLIIFAIVVNINADCAWILFMLVKYKLILTAENI
jgi:hypothetical protein